MLYSSLSAGYYGEITSLEHDTDYTFFSSIIQVDTDTYVLAHEGPNQDGFLTTFTISADGSTITEVASLEHDTGKGTFHSLIKILDSDTYIVAYTGPGDDGYIATFTISTDGSTITEVATLDHENDHSYWPSLVHVDTDTYALAASGPLRDGYITTFTISTDGSTITEVAR